MSDNRIDSKLIEQAQQGDTRAFDVLWQRHSHAIERHLFNMGLNKDDREDAICEVFILAWKNINTVKDKDRFNVWLRTVARHVGYKILGEHRRRFCRELSLDECPEIVERIPIVSGCSNNNEPLLAIIQAEQRKYLNEAILKLSHQEQSVLGNWLQRVSFVQMAEKLNEPEGTIRSRFARLKVKMRQFLNQQWDSG